MYRNPVRPFSANDMTKKQTVKTIAFLGIFVILLTMLTYMLRTNGAVKDRFVGFYAERKNTIDAVLIGSSPVFPYYATPEIYGEKGFVVYPLSTNLQRPVAQLYLAKEAEKQQDPQLYIFEVRMYTGNEHEMARNMAYTRGVTDNLRYSANRIETINAMLDETGIENGIEDSDTVPYTYYFDIFKYHANWRSLHLLSQWKAAFYAVADPHKGYEAYSDLYPCTIPDLGSVEGRTPIPEIQDQHLSELMDWLKEGGHKALFIVSPYLHTEEQQEMLNYIGDRVTAEGFDFLDMNRYLEEIGIDGATDYKDNGNHTNALGAGKVTKFFEEYLAEHEALPDRRGDKTYASWDRAYERWLDESAADIATVLQHAKDGTYVELP